MVEKVEKVEKAERTERTKKGSQHKSPKKPPAIYPVEDLAVKNGIKSWELAGLRQYFKWFDGKQVSEKDFNDGLKQFRLRPQGGPA